MSSVAPSYIADGYDQICFVVEDVEKAVHFWTTVNGVTKWQIIEGLADGQVEKEVWGKPAEFDHTCAYGVIGETLVELAQPTSGHSLYDDWLAEGRRDAHHIGFLVDPDRYDEAVETYVNHGIEKAMGGLMGDVCRWSYWDTRQHIGCFTELYWVTADAVGQLEKFISGESDVLIPM